MTISTKGLQHLGFLPDIDFVLQDNGAGVEIRDWNSSSPIPNEADIESAYFARENDYARNRLEEYPSIEECVHAMLDDGLAALQEKRAAVKAKYPKEVS